MMDLLHKHKKILFLDIEMTGNFRKAGKGAKIVEVAMKLVQNYESTYEIIEDFNELINPHEKMNPYAVKITGITNSMLKGKPSFFKFESKIQDLISRADIIVLHDGVLDVIALTEHGIRMSGKRMFNTKHFFELVRPDNLKTSLEAACVEFDVDVRNSHRAMSDVNNMMSLYYRMTNQNVNNVCSLGDERMKRMMFTYQCNV